MIPSSYQQDIFVWVRKAIGKPKAALVVEAGPGSGKTTTAVAFIELLPKTQRACFLAFSKHIAVALQAKVPSNVTACTINSLGWRACRQARPGILLEENKVFDTIRATLSEEHAKRWGGAIKKLISLKRAMRKVPAVQILQEYDIEVDASDGEAFLQDAVSVWRKIVADQYRADFDDQWYMPVQHGWPVDQFDWCIVDEAQDLSATQVELIQRIAPRIVVIGDPFQSIYKFRGADPESMSRLTKELEADTLPLSICYRCPTRVITLANEVIGSNKIQAALGAAEGDVDQISTKDFLERVSPGDWVLCRTTAPLVRRCLQLISEGKKASVKGRDIGQVLVGFIKKLASRLDEPITPFIQRAALWVGNESARLDSLGREAQKEALSDRWGAVCVLSEGVTTVQDVLDKIEKVFSDQASPGVNFATAHRAKGLEAAHIYILRPDLMPFPKGDPIQERNLKYVAVTRAMSKLTWVTKEVGE